MFLKRLVRIWIKKLIVVNIISVLFFQNNTHKRDYGLLSLDMAFFTANCRENKDINISEYLVTIKRDCSLNIYAVITYSRPEYFGV